jgi:hypothetical protein
MRSDLMNRSNYKKLGWFYRSLAGFFLACVIINAVGMLYAVFTEPFDTLFIFMAVFLIFTGHIGGSILFTGFAPKYLLFAHGPRKDSEKNIFLE